MLAFEVSVSIHTTLTPTATSKLNRQILLHHLSKCFYDSLLMYSKKVFLSTVLDLLSVLSLSTFWTNKSSLWVHAIFVATLMICNHSWQWIGVDKLFAKELPIFYKLLRNGTDEVQKCFPISLLSKVIHWKWTVKLNSSLKWNRYNCLQNCQLHHQISVFNFQLLLYWIPVYF